MADLEAFPFPIDFCDDRRAIALGTKLGDPWAWRYVVKIWCWAAQHAVDGVFTGLDVAQDLEAVAVWAGVSGQLFEALVSAGWVDRIGRDKYELHYWAERVMPVISRIQKNRERASAHYQKGKSNSTRRLRADYAQRVDSPAGPGALLDLPADLQRDETSNSPTASSVTTPVQELIPLPMLAPPAPARKARAKSRQDLAYDFFREQRAEKTGAPDTKPPPAEFNRRLGAVLDEVGVPAWKRIVVSYLQDDEYPRSHCTPQWPIRYLLSQYARYYSPPELARDQPSKPVQVSADELLLRASVLDAYATQTGNPYPWQPVDEIAVRECLSFAESDVALVVSRWEFALASQRWPRCSSLRQLSQRWADVERAQAEEERKHRGDVPNIAGWRR